MPSLGANILAADREFAGRKRSGGTAVLAALALAGCATAPAEVASAPVPVAAPAAATLGGDAPAPDPMRWTYGSGEAAAAAVQAWRALADYTIAVSRQRKLPQSVPLGLPDAPGGIGTPACQRADGTQKPFAAVFDVDETVILNRGYEYWLALGNPFRPDDFTKWAKDGAPYAVPVPGAVTGIRRLREAGIAVVYNTNRPSSTAAGTIAAIEKAGVGPAVHGETLFLAGDDALGGNKDGRRRTISDSYCVIALGGDNLGDFAERFNDKALTVHQRRELAARGDIARLWGNGWFLIPNAAYGAWQKGTIDDVFPPDARWTPDTPTRTAPDITNEGE